MVLVTFVPCGHVVSMADIEVAGLEEALEQPEYSVKPGIPVQSILCPTCQIEAEEHLEFVLHT